MLDADSLLAARDVDIAFAIPFHAAIFRVSGSVSMEQRGGAMQTKCLFLQA
jgi:hypothetical protein